MDEPRSGPDGVRDVVVIVDLGGRDDVALTVEAADKGIINPVDGTEVGKDEAVMGTGNGAVNYGIDLTVFDGSTIAADVGDDLVHF